MFCLVRNRENRKQFSLTKTANTTFMYGISDPELRKLYNRSRFSFLPLLDAVANNALLKGLSMGKQILVSDLPAVRYYGTDQVACLDKDTTTETAGNAISRLLDTSSLQESRLSIQKHVKANFSCPRRAKGFLEEYSNLLSKG